MSVRRVRALVVLILGLLLGGAFGLRVNSARADTTLGSYSAIASAPGIEFTEDEPSAQAHPEGQGDAPYTTSSLINGGVGYALSTIAWPGAYGGNGLGNGHHGPTPALELIDVHSGYGRIEVVHGVSLVVPPATVFALLGPNGAGKSTLLRVASGGHPA